MLWLDQKLLFVMVYHRLKSSCISFYLVTSSHGAEAAEDEAPERPKRQSAFRGSGYRLGETEAEMTEVIQGGPMSAGPKKVSWFKELFV